MSATSISGRHYDQIPDFYFEQSISILDVGCMTGLNAILSRHREHFLKAQEHGTYQGIDIKEYDRSFLSPIDTCDILEYNSDRKYDLVLALHVVEHITFENWLRLFSILRSLVTDGGYLIVATPFNQRDTEIEGHPEHVVFNIREKTLSSFMNDATFSKHLVGYKHFRNHGEKLSWAILRFVWRLLTRNKYRYRRLYELIAIEQKKSIYDMVRL